MNLHKFNQEEEKLGDHADWVKKQEDCLISNEDWNQEWRIKEEEIDVKHLFDSFLCFKELEVDNAHHGGLEDKCSIAFSHLRQDFAKGEVVKYVIFLVALVKKLQLLTHNHMS